MAAPTPTARQTPSGIMLRDGHSSLVTIGADPDCSVWEKTVNPPGVDGGDSIEQTTMHNDDWRTFAPRSLKTLTESTFKASYDPIYFTQLLLLINVRTTITITWREGSTLAFYGYLKAFIPDELAEGTQPEATVTILPTNWD